MYEIKYYSVSKIGKPFVHISTRPFAIKDGESIPVALARLEFTIKSDEANAEQFDRYVYMTTVRYQSEASAVNFAEVLYTDSFTF